MEPTRQECAEPAVSLPKCPSPAGGPRRRVSQQLRDPPSPALGQMEAATHNPTRAVERKRKEVPSNTSVIMNAAKTGSREMHEL